MAPSSARLTSWGDKTPATPQISGFGRLPVITVTGVSQMRSNSIRLATVIAASFISLRTQELAPIRADVNLVQLHVRVTDTGGHAVPGLGKSAFRLFVDDTAQELTVFRGEDAPVTAGIVIDNSASMAKKRNEVITAALAFARASNPKDEMFVIHFNNAVRFGLPDGIQFTGSISDLETAIAGFSLGGTTAFYDALLAAESHLQFAAFSRRVLLTITDGGDNSSRATLSAVIDGARQASAVIYSIGVFDAGDRDRNPVVLDKLADQTGGRASFPQEISGMADICMRIAQEVREQYTLGFAGASDGKYHRISVTVADPSYGPLKAHTRAGYLANRPSADTVQK